MSATEIWQIRKEEAESRWSADPKYLAYVKRQAAHEFADFCALLFDCNARLERTTFTQTEEHRYIGTPREYTAHIYTITAEVSAESEADMRKLKQEARP